MESPVGNPQDLLSDCTCPICRELFVNPQRLACRHTLCRKCVHKMTQKAEEESLESELNPFDILGLFNPLGRSRAQISSKRTLRCPICREESESFEPDDAAVSLVHVLRLLRDTKCCNATDCLVDATVLCPCCNKHFCQTHYEAQMAAVKAAGVTLCQGIRSLLCRNGAVADQHGQLQSALDTIPEVQAALTEKLQKAMNDFRQQVQECQTLLATPAVGDDARAVLEGDIEAAEQLLKCGNLSGLARLLPKATERLRAAQRSYPPRLLALQFQPSQLISDFENLMHFASASTYQSPYTEMPAVLSRVQVRGLTQKPWDIGILTNLEGVVCVDGSLRLVSDESSAKGSKLSGPLLVINAQSFPTKMLHVTDMEVKQVATITPRFGPEGMPGRMHIYNERQLILVSDAGRHKVFVFNLEGQLLTSFGEKGADAGQFHAPLGLSACDGCVFVVDSKNKRVQVFAIDSGYSCVASIQHAEFSEGIHSVLANGRSVFVVDRNLSRVFVFDRETQAPVSAPLTLEGKPFDIVPDEFGNALVTLVEEGKVQVVHRFGSLRTIGFKETHENQAPNLEHMMFPLMSMMPSTPRRMFHGAAFELTRRRLFIADLMRSCIVVADL